VEIVQKESRALRNFRSSCKNPKLFQFYNRQLNIFLEYVKKSHDEILALEINDLQDTIEDYVMSLGERGLKGSSTRVMVAAVEKFLDSNRKLYFKKAVFGKIQDNGNPTEEIAGRIPYTTEEIRRMLSVTTKLRTKALIHFFASTGARPQSLLDPVLRMKHLFEMSDRCYAIRVYDLDPTGSSENSKHGYWVFLTPEARQALDNYHKARKLNGEKFDDETPLFDTENEGSKNTHLGLGSVYDIVNGVIKAAAIPRRKIDSRYDKPIVYGFRKRFNTILKIDSAINSNIAEKLMAHKKGLDGTYLTPTREECFAEFRKAIPDLTIDDSERQKITIRKFQAERSELETTKLEVNELKEFKERFLHLLEDMQSNPDKYLKKPD
jgi:integrase